MDPLLDFTGKVAVITGAARGFGKLLAEELAKRGAKLVISDINEQDVKKAADEISATGAHIIGVKCDVSRESECKAMMDTAIENFGAIDIAVNNAGVADEFHFMHQVDESVMDKQFSVNVKGVQFGMKHQIAQMLTQDEGVILNVSSVAGLCAAPRLGAYSMAKHAVIGLTKTAAAEYGKNNIRVNAICPFFTLTNMVTDFADDDMQGKMGMSAPLRRLAKPIEIVNVMLMILSPGNTFMTGQSVAVDGGFTSV